MDIKLTGCEYLRVGGRGVISLLRCLRQFVERNSTNLGAVEVQLITTVHPGIGDVERTLRIVLPESFEVTPAFEQEVSFEKERLIEEIEAMFA